MKIISGNLSGRLIKSPKGRLTRPTSARAKESLFNFLVHGLRFNFDQVHVLDLFIIYNKSFNSFSLIL